MENWNNLNKLLSLNVISTRLKEQESQSLIELCQKGDKEEIKKILKTGANINCFADNSTPLISCIENDKYDLAIYLLSIRASISYKPKEEADDAFWYALKNKKHNFLSLFIDNKCILSIDNTTRQSALIYATLESDVEAVKILLSHYRINVSERDGTGNTALHHNVSKQNPSQDDMEIGQMLIAAGADTSARNMEGKTPEEEAIDFSAKSMLLANKMDKQLEEKEEIIPEIDLEDINAVPRTANNKIKI